MKTNLFLFATPRSGSTQVETWLSNHPDIHSLRVKEPNFFSIDDFINNLPKYRKFSDVPEERIFTKHSNEKIQFSFLSTIENYTKLVNEAPKNSKYVLDSSTTYLPSNTALQKIFNYNPSSKFLLLARDPVERALSHYKLHVMLGREPLTLTEAIKRERDHNNGKKFYYTHYIGGYNTNIADKFLEIERLFGRGSVLILDHQLLKNNPTKLLKSCAEFLCIENNFGPLINNTNESKNLRFRKLNQIITKAGLKNVIKFLLGPKYIKGLKEKLPTTDWEIDDVELSMLKKYINEQ